MGYYYFRRLLFLFVFCSTQLVAQDMQFTQFYAAPTYLNPAFTGANACSRLSTNYRNQWPSIPGAFVSQIVSYDHFFSKVNSGFGAMITNDKAGSGKLRQTSYSLLYAHELSITRKFSLRSGMQATGNVRSLNFNNLLFGDQLYRDDAPTSVELPPVDRSFYFDLSAGTLLFSKEGWLGFSAHHLNVPNQSLIEGESKVPIKFSLHGGAKIATRRNEKEQIVRWITPAFNYRAQGKFDQFDVGLYYSTGLFEVGAWYRGIPGLKAYETGYNNNDAIAILGGVTIERFRFAYSYDYTVSRLITNTGGAHEVSLSYQFCVAKVRRKTKSLLVPCPKF
jgi:type IX secretion system PorP/SprF family membrane protein